MSAQSGTRLIVLGAAFDALACLILVYGLTRENKSAALFALVPGLFGAALVLGGLIVRANAAKKLTGEGAKKGNSVGAYMADVDDVRDLDGRPFVVHYQTPVSGKNGRPSKLTIKVNCATPTAVRFARETGFDRFCKAAGIAAECETGDEAFDGAVYVRCPSLEYAQAYCADPAKRFAVLALRDLGFPEVQLTGSDAEAVWVGFLPEANDAPDLPGAAAAALLALATELPQVPDVAAVRAAREPAAWPLWVFLLAWGAMAFAYGPFQPVYPGAMVLLGVGLGLIGYLAFGYAAAWLLSGGSASHDKWKLLLIVGAFLVPAGFAGALALLNGALDDAAPVVRSQVVVNKRTSKSKNKTNYHLRIAHWAGGGDTLEYRVSQGEWMNATVGRSRIEVTTRPGALGYEWWTGKRVVP